MGTLSQIIDQLVSDSSPICNNNGADVQGENEVFGTLPLAS